jgi:protein TonB
VEYFAAPFVCKLEGGNMKDHKRMYGIYLRAGILSSIVVFIMLFLFVPYAQPVPYELKHEIITMVEDISAYIDKYEEPPPAERPKVALPAENEIGEENVVETIAEAEFREDLIRTRPTGPEIEIVPYYKVEVKPQPLVQAKPRYPDLARRAGIEGQTVVKALVDIDGSIRDVQILKSSGNAMLDEAALAAARNWKFSPAKQRDKYVRVYVSIPVNFRLVDSG